MGLGLLREEHKKLSERVKETESKVAELVPTQKALEQQMGALIDRVCLLERRAEDADGRKRRINIRVALAGCRGCPPTLPVPLGRLHCVGITPYKNCASYEILHPSAYGFFISLLFKLCYFFCFMRIALNKRSSMLITTNIILYSGSLMETLTCNLLCTTLVEHVLRTMAIS